MVLCSFVPQSFVDFKGIRAGHVDVYKCKKVSGAYLVKVKIKFEYWYQQAASASYDPGPAPRPFDRALTCCSPGVAWLSSSLSSRCRSLSSLTGDCPDVVVRSVCLPLFLPAGGWPPSGMWWGFCCRNRSSADPYPCFGCP